MVSSAVLLLDVVVVVLTAAQELQIKDRADCTAQSVQLGTLTHCSVLQQQLQAPAERLSIMTAEANNNTNSILYRASHFKTYINGVLSRIVIGISKHFKITR